MSAENESGIDRRRNDGTEVTALLRAIDEGDDRQSAAELLPLVYDELRRLARARVARLPPGQTIQPTALVHEAYVKLVGRDDPGWKGRAHFFGAAAQAMRDLLVDLARRKGRLKHGGDRRRVDLDDDAMDAIRLDSATPDLIALDGAIDALARRHERAGQVVMLRQFAGLDHATIAELLGVARGTIDRDWRFALAWMHRVIEGEIEGETKGKIEGDHG